MMNQLFKFIAWDGKNLGRVLIMDFVNKTVVMTYHNPGEEAAYVKTLTNPDVFPWSGLVDRRNQEIYVGHICRQMIQTEMGSWYSFVNVMTFVNGAFILQFESEIPMGVGAEPPEIIGHILTHPHLLPKKSEGV
jgi:hypothetical protein